MPGKNYGQIGIWGEMKEFDHEMCHFSFLFS